MLLDAACKRSVEDWDTTLLLSLCAVLVSLWPRATLSFENVLSVMTSTVTKELTFCTKPTEPIVAP